MQEVHLTLDHENFYCPVTGELILGSDVHQPSPATVFTYLNEVGDFEEITPELRDIFDSIEEDADDFARDVFEKFAQRVTDESIVCFTIVLRGMACGPVSSTVRIGINMNYKDESTSD